MQIQDDSRWLSQTSPKPVSTNHNREIGGLKEITPIKVNNSRSQTIYSSGLDRDNTSVICQHYS